MRKGLSEAQRAALVRMGDSPGGARICMLGASRPTRDALRRSGYAEERFPGCLSITPAGREALANQEQGR